jgi:hypothetical protein
MSTEAVDVYADRGVPMWLWIGVGLGSFIGVSLRVALAFARVLGALNGGVVELLEDRPSPPATARVQKPEAEESTSTLAVHV